LSKHKQEKDTIVLAELSRVYFQLKNGIITKEQANEMLKITNTELSDLDTIEINSIKQEIKEKENLIYKLLNEIYTLQEQLQMKGIILTDNK